ncbi:MAG: hypothetical protein COA79_09505 [Planctomycetota bacterium]|nr:MAG: hypothetical protein COA79_09505 [Planctomycetota bacterium]
MKFEKIFLDFTPHLDDHNIRILNHIDTAAWVWHPDLTTLDSAFVKFIKTFESKDETIRVHLSADMRFEFMIDNIRVCRGPDRADPEHWSFSSYDITLEAGEHQIEVLVWHLHDDAPLGLPTYQPGFIFAAEGEYDNLLSTGKANWNCSIIHGWKARPKTLKGYFFVVGNSLEINLGQWKNTEETKKVIVIKPGLKSSGTGLRVQGWKLFPSTMPDQYNSKTTPGEFRAITHKWHDNYQFTEKDCAEIPTNYQKLFNHESIHIPPNTNLTLIWDLKNYYCAYSEIAINKGKGTTIEWLWAESLFDETKKAKLNRNDIAGKYFDGHGNKWIADGSKHSHRSHWWWSGRYILINIKTKEEELIINELCLDETNYPLTYEGSFETNDDEFTDIQTIATRVMQMCAHEHFMDCPYYEQLMYVGDTRLEILTNFIMQQDHRLPARCIDLFDFSRRDHGFVAEHTPSRQNQLSTTFSMISCWLIHDYLMWRGSKEWLQDRIYGVRSALDQCRIYLREDNLIGKMPGWPFMDWVPEWKLGNVPTSEELPTAPINIMYYWTLRKAAELETHLNETEMASRYNRYADEIAEKIIPAFFDEKTGLFADDLAHLHYSEHAQCLALLSGLIKEDKALSVFENMLGYKDLARTTIYFSYYLFETMKQFDRGDLIIEKFDFWKKLKEQGFKTAVEQPEPSRSDCHAWGAHPMYHMHASLMGIRPTSIGFGTIEIKPSPGDLTFIKSKTPHPLGMIECDLKFEGNTCKGSVNLPEGLTGQFIWRNKTIDLQSNNKIMCS